MQHINKSRNMTTYGQSMNYDNLWTKHHIIRGITYIS